MDTSNWPKGLPYPTSWLRGVALNVTFFGIIHLFWRNIGTASDIEKLATVAWFCQIPLMAGYHYVAVRLADQLERSRTDSPNTSPTGSWQHWKEGLAGFLVLFLAVIVTSPVADAIAPIYYSRNYYRYSVYIDKALLIYGILSTIASAYLYYWKIPSRFNSLIVFCWPLINTYLKTQQLLYIPLISCFPVAAISIIVAALASKLNLSEVFLGLGVFLVVIMWFFATATAFAAIHYYGAHWANWIASWWPESFPGYNHLQQKKTQKHNASVSKSFIRHETSWKLAAHDFTVIIYTNVLSGIASIPIYIAILNELSSEASQGKPTETSEALSGALYLVWTTIAMILWHFWGRKQAAKIMAATKAKATKGKAKTTKKAKKTKAKTPADPIEVELNQIKGELGATVMRPVRKTATSQQVLWEVFRSGPVGPYTKEQLRSQQKITAKTNVRRVGENDWTRAGEIPELADFLSSKS
ncbi:DUF4339 domain-containing protein [Kamptonema animale CS-326]|jgi:hypothetical protein|uniref:DUF4339 domain-containing protein n=1 Tax=Kamptonema animale TaxID=92934 RepID=UPI00232DE0AE|nr:DUF4339 domain-containing protein [Kamptonema animale]MDB9513065.1 DUF4339 domain-containing protein [Kamptonema animale CS-326]